MNPLAPILLSDAKAVAAANVDCLIIGSGTSGVTAAIELADRGLRVAIIEAGPLILTEHVGSGPFANREDIVPQIHDLVRYGTIWTSEKDCAAAQSGSMKTNNNAWSVVGGRTIFWGGCTPRFRTHHGWAAWSSRVCWYTAPGRPGAPVAACPVFAPQVGAASAASAGVNCGARPKTCCNKAREVPASTVDRERA